MGSLICSERDGLIMQLQRWQLEAPGLEQSGAMTRIWKTHKSNGNQSPEHAATSQILRATIHQIPYQETSDEKMDVDEQREPIERPPIFVPRQEGVPAPASILKQAP